MYLKQLTLRGFKSFASATTMVFEPGITCVVGPNGSGKSNVVDALSWVMGEQGAKSLRGGKMEDVIFAGTARRAPLGRAEVELTIDNSDGALPIEYSEVTITRTMFRSGGSEYQINGSTARLLDVQELLSDSGIGREMHVIVGQGQLDVILQATPESRRGFIEEAAGVLKHRKRKEKALRKLEATKANLERLTDLVRELGRQLKPLGRQAAAARKAVFIQAELRDAKARLLADDLAGARQALQTELADEKAMAEAKEHAERQLREAIAGEQTALQRLKEAGAQYDRSQETWYSLSALKERINSTISIATERANRSETQPELEIVRRDPDQLERESREAGQREQQLRDQVSQASAELAAATDARNRAEEAHAAAEADYAQELRAAADRREGLARLTGKLNAARSRVEAANEEKARLEQRRTEALARLELSRRESQMAAEALAGLGGAESELDEAYEKAIADTKDRLAEITKLRNSTDSLLAQRVALEAKVEALALLAERKDGAAELLNDPALSTLGRLSDQITVGAGWESAIAAALGSAAEAVVVDSMATAEQAVALLESKSSGRAHLIVTDQESSAEAPSTRLSALEVVSAPASLYAALSWLLEGTVLVEDADEARAALSGVKRAVTRSGTVYSRQSVEGGTSSGTSLIEVKAQLTESRKQLQELSIQAEELEQWSEVANRELETAQNRERELLNQLHSSDAALSAATEQLHSHNQAAAVASDEAARLASAIEQTGQVKENALAAVAELEQRLVAANQEDATEPDSTTRDELAVSARLARQQEMDARLRLRTVEEQMKAISGRAAGLIRAAQQERQARAKAQARLEEIRQESAVAGVVHEAAQELLHHIEGTLSRAANERERANLSRKEAESKVTDSRQRVREATARMDELVAGAHREEMSRIELRIRIEQLEEKGQAELGLGPEELLRDYGPELPTPKLSDKDGLPLPEEEQQYVPYDREQQQRRLRVAQRNLQALGKVNPLALEEFDAMTARHKFLSDQLDDIRETRADLAEIVREVDQKVEEVFEKAYLDVERAFGQVFERLFPGGEGKLLLTEPGDWLNTGVDVEAKPAGKQVKRLSLLSGGERSLVAVAFLFALFIARPSPFYILDEVEAALDDANLGRLLRIYEELRENSQLLIITHQKRTMEIADSLYGVTMRGDGISTVISQRLHD